MNNKSIIQAEDLVKSFAGLHAVDGVSFDISPGRCVGLLGPNGAGKTTTMRMIMGLTTPTKGHLRLFGQEAGSLSRTQKARIGLVPQENNLDQDLSVAQNLWTYGRYYGLGRQYLKHRVPELLAFMELTEKTHTPVFTLSGGMKRRLIIARALIADPEIVILDEPTTGLDPQARVMIWQLLNSLKQAGKTLLLTTHYMDEAERLSDDIIVIDEGRVLDKGTPQELISRHVARYVLEMEKTHAKEHILKKAVRHEDLGNTFILYTDTPKEIAAALPHDAAHLQRSANLEDVFLCLTGRKLRE